MSAAAMTGADGASVSAPARTGLLIDFGGVLTTNIFESFAAFCRAEGIDPGRVRDLFRSDPEGRELLFGLETGEIPEQEFERRFAALIGVADPANLIDRLFGGMGSDEAMIGAVRAARKAGVRTGMVSNSWGHRVYDRDLLDEIFDGVVISADEGIRKPNPAIYALGAQRIGLEPDACVFVDDLAGNLKPAREMGMATVHHVEASETIAQLEGLLGVALGG